jgi:hypothetical protein
MREFGLLRAIGMSIFSADLYRDVGRNWNGVGLLYLTVLLAICWAPTSIRLHVSLHRFAVERVPRVLADLPEITIKAGVMQANPPGRHVWRDEYPRPGRDAGAFIIDDSIDEVPSDLPPGTIMLTRREFGGARRNSVERRVFQLSAVGDVHVTRERARGWLTALQFWVPPIAYVAALIGSVIVRFVQACVYAVVAQALARGQQVMLDFAAALRVVSVAMSPWIVLRTLIWFLPAEPLWYIRWPFAIAMTLAYMWFAVAALAAEAEHEPRPAAL